MSKLVISIIVSISIITSILFAFPSEKNKFNDGILNKTPTPTTSRVIIGEGAKVIVQTKALAKLWYDNIELLQNAKLVKDEEDSFDLSKDTSTDNLAELSNGESALPTELSISKAYPNPFNPIVNISYGLPKSGDVKIVIHDLSGRKITAYSINQQTAGWHEFSWNALDTQGQAIGSGVYLLTIQASNMVKKQKITFLK